MDFEDLIKSNNATHEVNSGELDILIKKANTIFNLNHSKDIWFERSIFINWTCGIANCKYCYLSTKEKKNLDALRSKESILAEILICKLMGWKVGYLTGGLRVESNDYLVNLIKECNNFLDENIKINFGPYSNNEVDNFKPFISGIGSAIESFDEDLHNFICPSKPLKNLKNMLYYSKQIGLPTFITIILGMGEKKEDVEKVIENIHKFDIKMIQLCYLKPQKNTIFSEVPSPNIDYMTWWVAKIRIACPKLIIKIALVDSRIEGFSQLLNAGVNCFSRFMVFKSFGTDIARNLEQECKNANRNLIGNFTTLPKVDFEIENVVIKEKFIQYYEKLKKNLS